MIRLLSEHQGDEQVLVISSAQGEPVELGLTVSSLITAGRDAGKVLTIEDLSVKRKLEELLRRSDRLSYLGLFTAGIAHELRNPLTSIKGYAQLLQAKSTPTNRDKYLHVIIRETERLDSLLSQLLTFARPSSERLVLKSLEEVLAPTLEMVEEKAREQKVEVVRKFQPTPPVLVDEQKIQQVFWNILLNALQAMPDGGLLTVSLQQSADEVEVVIADNGSGMTPSQQTQIFAPFFTTRERGSGLGLAISLRIVETLGGRIDFVSEQGRGTIFWIRLPASKRRGTMKIREQFRVLIADDEVALRGLLREILEGAGINRIEEVSNGEEALLLLRQKPFDLLFLDIKMPKRDGLSVLREMSGKEWMPRTIVITAFGDFSMALEATKLGAFDYINKPFDIEEIKRQAEKALHLQELEEEVRVVRSELSDKDLGERIVGHSEMMLEIIKTIGRIANSAVTVLIMGESGTGKRIGGAHNPPRFSPHSSTATAGELRRHPGATAGKRAVWLREGSVHRRPLTHSRQVRSGSGRNDLLGRDRGHDPQPASQTPSRAARPHLHAGWRN